MNCECLAAWVDTEPCICNEPIGAPMEVSAAKLAEANRLVSEIRQMDRALATLKAGSLYRSRLWYDHHNDYALELRLPADIAQGIIRTMRFHALVKLSETGVVSTSAGHRPVVSA